MPEAPSAAAKVVTALIIGLILGFVAGVFWQERRLVGEAAGAVEKEEPMRGEASDIAEETGDGDAARVEPATAAAGFFLSVKNQPAGETVLVESVVAGEPVWVAVREEKNGAAGNILGAQKVQGGTYIGVLVELLRPTQSGAAYSVTLHSATGSPAFNYREDLRIGGVEGKFTAH